jgi:gliding motility-associated-like protein
LKILISILFFNIIFLSGYGQYAAPELKCAQKGPNEVDLSWKTVTELCGAFVSYDIHYAPTKAGPYTVLTTIPSFSTITYQHSPVTPAQNFCYFLTSNYACPGVSNTSDTFCSVAVLTKPQLLSISIENGFPVYRWVPDLNLKQVWAHAIFSPAKSIDTFKGYKTNSGIDSSFDVTSGVYTGSVYAMDSCGGSKGRSPYDRFHRPCFVTLVNNPCADEIEINWTPYQGWGPNDEVKDFEIWVQINANPEIKVGTNIASIRTFRYNGYVFGDKVCIRVKANHPTDPTIYSYSNQLCFTSTKSQKPDILQTLSASYIDNYETKIRWYCSTNSIPKNFDLVKRNIANGLKLETIEKIVYKNEGKGFYSYQLMNGESNQAVYYQLVYEDQCNNKSAGSTGATNFIKVTQVGLYINEISWPKKYFPDTVKYTIKKFEVYFSPDMVNYTKVSDLNPTETKYTHLVENLYQTDGKFCYKVVVHYNFDTLTPVKDSSFSMSSQLACVLMRTVMWVPNAFKVNGYTPTFKPKMYFFSQQLFRMKIFNRWGQQIFETNDPNTGWNGIMSNGQAASEDSYIYHINFIGNDGVSVDKTGNFTLLK